MIYNVSLLQVMSYLFIVMPRAYHKHLYNIYMLNSHTMKYFMIHYKTVWTRVMNISQIAYLLYMAGQFGQINE